MLANRQDQQTEKDGHEASLATNAEPVRDMYLELLAQVLTRSNFPISHRSIRGRSWRIKAYAPVSRLLGRWNLELVGKVDPIRREYGQDLPADAETMVGMKRLIDLRSCVENVLRDRVEGDLLEAGVWRGGACIFMRGVLKAHHVDDRIVWVADSFQGMPSIDEERYPADKADWFGQWHKIAIPLEEVRNNFARYRLLDEQVMFLPGWFEQSLTQAPIDRLAILRMDADLYASTTQILDALYDRVSVGGYVIVDDYAIETCRKAVEDFRSRRGIDDPVTDIDGTAARWRKSRVDR